MSRVSARNPEGSPRHGLEKPRWRYPALNPDESLNRELSLQKAAKVIEEMEPPPEDDPLVNLQRNSSPPPRLAP
eukprot:CAMPEP_0175937054 /NCGR_PEP_ID=MMETSP0108-20121206/21933_1 /TAXON_ID=195067 ORGANISM="Goniomonas pacifica, Strain CCMP1869" /NCGR_SAMPLE_ID=MMETSP0108 /ASSEMBLY_ACC=CAM_ASM_000204 /LENGTH=73 /DNA_ID=CAMNT_0017261163 /DNA_START=141 /DNA_END=362 /DNA_ORIENTATION=+